MRFGDKASVNPLTVSREVRHLFRAHGEPEPEFNSSLFALGCIRVPHREIAAHLRSVCGQPLPDTCVMRWLRRVQSVPPEFELPLRTLACTATARALLLAAIAASRNPALQDDKLFSEALGRARLAHDALFACAEDLTTRPNWTLEIPRAKVLLDE